MSKYEMEKIAYTTKIDVTDMVKDALGMVKEALGVPMVKPFHPMPEIYAKSVLGPFVNHQGVQVSGTLLARDCGGFNLVRDPDYGIAGGFFPSNVAQDLVEYERSAHRKTTELLIERDRKCQQLEGDLDQVMGQANKLQWEFQRAATQGFAIGDVLDLMEPIVHHLFDTTNSAKVHADCKAALAAYEALHAALPDPAPDPAPVGQEVRHTADCQGERAGGVAGVQPPGAPAGKADRAGPVGRFFDGILQSGGFDTAYIEWDREGIQHPNFCLDPKSTRRLIFEAKHYEGSRQECLRYACEFAASLKLNGQAALWRVPPSLDSQISFETGMTQYRFYCRYGSIPEAEALKIKGVAWRRTVA